MVAHEIIQHHGIPVGVQDALDDGVESGVQRVTQAREIAISPAT
ncbi:hypothetical protein ABZT02_39380 [Streptomyces sp. NPDC005402]